MLIAIVVGSVAHAACPPPPLEFVGAPDCIDLIDEFDGTVRVDNHCPDDARVFERIGDGSFVEVPVLPGDSVVFLPDDSSFGSGQFDLEVGAESYTVVFTTPNDSCDDHGCSVVGGAVPCLWLAGAFAVGRRRGARPCPA